MQRLTRVSGSRSHCDFFAIFQIHNFSEIPLPSRIEAWMHQTEQQGGGKGGGPKRQQTRSLHELSNNMYDTLPKSLKTELAVRAKYEDPAVLMERRELTR